MRMATGIVALICTVENSPPIPRIVMIFTADQTPSQLTFVIWSDSNTTRQKRQSSKLRKEFFADFR